MEPQRRILDLIAMGERLIQLVERENGLLRRHQHAEVAKLTEEKASVARIYETRARALKEAPPAPGELDGPLSERLRAFRARITRALEENAILLGAALKASQRVVDVIAQALKEARPEAKTYAPARGKRPAPRLAQPRAASLSFDQTL